MISLCLSAWTPAPILSRARRVGHAPIPAYNEDMTDELTPDRTSELAQEFMTKYLEKAAERDLKPYVRLIAEGCSGVSSWYRKQARSETSGLRRFCGLS